MNEKLKKLYQSVILKHDKSPHNFAERKNATHIMEAFNPICGDRFTLYFEIKNGRICEVSFHGFGCAISKASTSVLTKKIEGKRVREAKKIIEKFMSQFAEGELNDNMESELNEHIDDEEMTAFLAARDFPGRLECATLAWKEMSCFEFGSL